MDLLRLGLVALAAALALLGLGLGATLQHEEHLQPDIQDWEGRGRGATGDPILLTGLLVAAGLALLLALLSRRSVRERLLPAAAAGAGLYVLTHLVQSAWPRVLAVGLPGQQRGELSINLLVAPGPGVPSVFVPPLALLAGALLAALWGARRLLGSPAAAPTPEGELRTQAAQQALALPFSAVAACGALRLVGELPGDAALARLLLPAQAVALLALQGVALAKLWHLGRTAQDGRWAPIALEAWNGLARAGLILLGVFALLAAAGFALPQSEVAALAPNATFGLRLQSHAVLLGLAALPLLPAFLRDRRGAQAIREAVPLSLPGAPQHALPWLACACTAACLALAALATWAQPDALAPWALAFLAALPLAFASRRADALPALLAAAFLAWALGNSLQATYFSSEGSTLVHAAVASAVAAARLAGLLLAGTALARLARHLGAGQRASLTIPLALVAAAATVVVGSLELPLEIWLVNTSRGPAVAHGTLLAAQAGTAQAAMHLVSLACTVAAALALARLHRPEWFGRRARPSVVLTPSPAAA